jgi:hypothetical protein
MLRQRADARNAQQLEQLGEVLVVMLGMIPR